MVSDEYPLYFIDIVEIVPNILISITLGYPNKSTDPI
jgi:hypothetical protein